MNRARTELLDITSTTNAQLEQIERDAARRRWCMDAECELLLARMDAAVMRRELTR